MKKRENEFENKVRDALKGKKIPIVVLDQRWHALFPHGEKPSEILALEEELNALLKRQGYLVNNVKDLKKAKQKLMNGIVAGMNDAEGSSTDKKKKNQQRLLLETKERIQMESDELMELPRQIKHTNEQLLIIGAVYCFERLANGDEELQIINEKVRLLKEELNGLTEFKADLEESMQSAYSLMHGILGHDVMNLYDRKNGRKT